MRYAAEESAVQYSVSATNDEVVRRDEVCMLDSEILSYGADRNRSECRGTLFVLPQGCLPFTPACHACHITVQQQTPHRGDAC